MVNDKIVLPRAQVAHYLHICHDDSGHSGVDRVMHLMQHLVWPGKTDDIVNYVSSCVTCLKRKGSYMQKTIYKCKIKITVVNRLKSSQ